MKFCLRTVAVSALLVSVTVAAPVELEKRDANSDRIASCFVGLLFTGAWPSVCKAAVAVNMGLIKSIAINQMSMDFTPADPWAPLTGSSEVVATMLSIPGISLPIDSVRQNIILSDNGVELGSIETPWSPATVKDGALKTSFPMSKLNVFPQAHTAFTSFVSAISTSASRTIGLKGSVDVKLNLGLLGHVTISGIGFDTTTPLAGLDNLSKTKYLYFVDTNFGVPGFLGLTSVINIQNPSKLSIKLGDVTFSTASKNGHVGTSTVKGLSLVPGDNFLLSDTFLDQSIPAGAQFLTDLYSSDGVLTLSGFAGSSPNPALNAGLQAVKTSLTIPMAFSGLVPSQMPTKEWSLKVLPNTKTDFIVQITASFQSPYYGHDITMISDNDGSSSNTANVAAGVSDVSAGSVFFTFLNNSKFTAKGSSSVKTTFTVQLPPFAADNKDLWMGIFDYAKVNKYVPIDFNWLPVVTIGADPNQHLVDWSTVSLGSDSVKIAVGTDFTDLINAFP